MIDEIKYPEITKKISTPIKPPGKISGKPWNRTTEIIAIARSPSISGLYFVWVNLRLWRLWIKKFTLQVFSLFLIPSPSKYYNNSMNAQISIRVIFWECLLVRGIQFASDNTNIMVKGVTQLFPIESLFLCVSVSIYALRIYYGGVVTYQNFAVEALCQFYSDDLNTFGKDDRIKISMGY